ncbi:hypothetical protein [Chitinophaga pinensis]|uniref:Uncharacterized protein n=1 Tax=Chitinophaga pinensis (strain ATCC 43595 / DSM 2588 / LMG 13176 / NBRC 15968 / NCIMB 11800 / UQM 2034) TaxID=485918 RepID=A0A979GR09_CHIPD|nr:hypothetical protein [Chitinophaga pinensis]ACU61957.1 hypothetical protein Cpin_4515 [Chitinophaga pinensis DSM 2588]
MKRYLFILPLFICSIVLAQTPHGPVSTMKFNIIKRTVEFLSTDTVSFKGITVNTCDGCANYEALKKFAVKMTKVDSLIDKWVKIEVGPDKAEMIKFSETVLNNISTGNARRENRRKLPGFKEYQKAVADIIAGNVTTPPAPIPDTQEPVMTTTPPTARQSDARQVGAAPAAEAPAEESADDLTAISIRNETEKLPWVFIGGTILGILLALYFYAALLKEKKKKEDLKKLFEKQKDKATALEAEKNKLWEDVKALDNKLREAQDKFIKLEESQATERKQYQQKVREARDTPAETPPPAINVSKEFVPIVKYARYADKIDGFSAEELLDKDDNETIFEITITSPATGAFRVSNNRQAQRYALSNASFFFGKTCQYEAFPVADSVIVTDKPGELVLSGDKWMIRHPAKIRFN